MNKNQVEVRLMSPEDGIGPLFVFPTNAEEFANEGPIDGPFVVRFISGHTNIVRDLGHAHVGVIMEVCNGKCLLNINDDGTPELIDGKKVLSISLIVK